MNFCMKKTKKNKLFSRKSGLKIPLHDHPNQHAVMKVYQGSVKIRSFSIIDCDESDDDDEGGGAASSSSASPVRVRYEGEIVLSSGSEQQHSAVLGPRNGRGASKFLRRKCVKN